jgi:hypothetical protein
VGRLRPAAVHAAGLSAPHCPVAERLHKDELLEFCICSFALSETEQTAVINAFHKVFDNLPALARMEKESA